MREYKFRVWDKKDKRMMYNFDGWSDTVDILKQAWEYLQEREYEVMQYTGLKDKNGKDIYEGDIVVYKYGYSISDPEDEPEEFYINKKVVKFINGEFTPREDGYYPDDYWYGYKIYDFEVIGNIHQNPELIKEV